MAESSLKLEEIGKSGYLAMGTLVFNHNLKITQLGKSGRIEEAIKLFSQMTQKNTVTYNSMISAYAKNGRIRDARHLFDKMPRRNLVSWNAMIAGYLHNDKAEEAYDMFVKMPKRDLFSWTLMITCYTRNGELQKAKQLFSLLPDKRDTVCWNAMIAGYSKKRLYDEAKRLFDEMPVKDLVSWNSMLAGYTKNGDMHLGVQFFEEMGERDVVSWNLIVDGFVEVGDLDSAWNFFKKMPEPNVVTCVTMLYGFARNGRIAEAQNLFEQMPSRNVVSWNAMLAAYVQDHQIDKAVKLFSEMPERDSISWTTMINGYVRVGKLDEARQLLHQIPYKNIAAQTAMISGYVQSKRMDEASEIFNHIGMRDVVCWNTMIAGKEGRRPDQSTLSCGLSACANLAALQIGEQLHHLIVKSGYGTDLFVCNALITMYAKCGKVFNAELMFKETGNIDIVSWNSLIAGYALNGYGKEAVGIFEKLLIEGMAPDQVTFIGVLSACSHAGLITQGLELFRSMTEIYKIEPLPEHYACMVDLLGRAGRLEEAFKMVLEMKVKTTPGIWGALLGAARIHRNLEIGKYAAEKLLEQEPHRASNYVLLSNIHAEAGRWKEVQRIRMLMEERRTEKQPGYSWIEVGNQVHSFLSDDAAQPRTAIVRNILKSLTAEMRSRNRVSDMKYFLLDVL
ncbi:hypothetical protein G4B88_021046 [Cannabis sativa]|uniref:Pentatricopeptide repeat-containing protein n=1 Tax=Cannabis sativa TaxID=3483 RepID=A0A7J6HX43_CANSA|nr:hypothetical protein G4B88_021046 [Cannabis sativa]